jgi:hypothetical protein
MVLIDFSCAWELYSQRMRGHFWYKVVRKRITGVEEILAMRARMNFDIDGQEDRRACLVIDSTWGPRVSWTCPKCGNEFSDGYVQSGETFQSGCHVCGQKFWIEVYAN